MILQRTRSAWVLILIKRSSDDETVGGILIGSWCASAGHNDDSGFGLRLEDLPHIDIGFLESAEFADDVLLTIVFDNVIDLYSVELVEDC